MVAQQMNKRFELDPLYQGPVVLCGACATSPRVAGRFGALGPFTWTAKPCELCSPGKVKTELLCCEGETVGIRLTDIREECSPSSVLYIQQAAQCAATMYSARHARESTAWRAGWLVGAYEAGSRRPGQVQDWPEDGFDVFTVAFVSHLAKLIGVPESAQAWVDEITRRESK